MIPNKRDCLDCRFVHEVQTMRFSADGRNEYKVTQHECRFNPPFTALEERDKPWCRTEFPMVKKWMWCHQFQVKPGMAEAVNYPAPPAGDRELQTGEQLSDK